jgi:hypothetical protein
MGVGVIMGFFGKKESSTKQSGENESTGGQAQGKYNEPCGLCGKSPTDKKWGGQYFHKKCFRKLKKGAKGML